MTAKLHEILAVERSAEQTAKKLTTESIRTLDGKEHLFKGSIRTLTMFSHDNEHLNAREETPLNSTVDENLDYLLNEVGDWYDVVYQKDMANTEAFADIVVDGEVIVEKVPATFLLGMESKLGQLREVYQSIPTLDPTLVWVEDATNEKPGVWVSANPAISFKTEKVTDFQIIVEPTEHHPAQVKELSKTVNVGKYETISRSGMFTPVEKACRIKQIDKLIASVKKARQRANDVKVTNEKISNKLFTFING